jgi:apolipoprotein N-acyltransferase
VPVREPTRWWSALLAVAGGLLTEAAFPDLGWWGSAFLGIAALFLALRRDSARWGFVVGLLWGLAFFAPQIIWADFAVGRVPWLALTVFESSYIGLFGALWAWARRGAVIWHSAVLQVPVFVVLWIAVEDLRSSWPFGGFPWGRLGFSQSDSPLAALAWLGGAPLVSAAVCLTGVLVALLVMAAKKLQLARAVGALAAVGVVLLVPLTVPLDTQAESGSLRVGAVQGNVPTPGIDAFAQARVVLDNHIAQTLALLTVVDPGRLDVVLWPENGTDVDPQVDTAAAAAIDQAARAVGAPMLVGTVQYPKTGGRYNTAVLWVPGVGVVASYTKQHPAPFAEYIPIRALVRPFSSAVDLVSQDMLPGTRVGVVPLNSQRLGRIVRLGDVICFEVAYDDLPRNAVRAGAEVLVVQTNNASFGYSTESTQQLAMSRLRAIELGRATVQISTVGVSAIIQPNGVVSKETTLFTPDHLVAVVPLRTSLTPAARLARWPVWTADALAIAAILAGMVGAARIRRTDREESDE